MIRVLLLFFTVAIFSFSSVIEFKDIDPKKSIIQIGTYSKEKTVKRIQKELEITQDIYIRKEKNFTVIYVVNIPKKSKKKTLQQIRKTYKDAFIQKKAYKVIKKSFVKKKKKLSIVVKQKTSSKIAVSKNINQDMVAIQIGTYSKEKTVRKIKKELENKRDIYIKKTKNYTIIYVVNIPNNEKRKVLKDLRKKYKDAFISKKVFKQKKKTPQKKSVTKVQTIEILERLYKEGLENFNQENYLKSYQLFKQIFKVDMKNMDVNFYLARSAYEIGNYKEALDIYDYMLFRDPHNNQIKLEVGKTYNKLKNYDKAKKYFVESYK